MPKTESVVLQMTFTSKKRLPKKTLKLKQKSGEIGKMHVIDRFCFTKLDDFFDSMREKGFEVSDIYCRIGKITERSRKYALVVCFLKKPRGVSQRLIDEIEVKFLDVCFRYGRIEEDNDMKVISLSYIEDESRARKKLFKTVEKYI